ncbi:hypothetical protein PLICRDRAFT_697768 [Plicaturopsis crispa FD-325 SS-3]|nr:hypothetical protein PLICRDRAFT_697768 [Plicaturopsis crispa FD-325 SS-3]
MQQRTRLSLFALFLAAFVWRNGRVMRNFLVLSDFPAGYYAGGDWQTQCEVIKDEPAGAMKYCEDATFWDQLDGAGKVRERLLLLSCDPNRKSWNTVMGPLNDPTPLGALWLYAPSATGTEKATPQRVVLQGYPQGHDFHPLGLEIYPSRDGTDSNLFVVNHARQRTVIEQFIVSPASPTEATWVRTISLKYFVSPNALALTSPTSFYVSNDHFFTRRLPAPFGGILPMIESTFALPFGWLAHVSLEGGDKGEVKVNHKFSAFGVPFANGVAISPDGRTVALSATSFGRVNFYARDAVTNDLTFTHAVQTPFTPDNIMYDDDGTLIVAGHPHFPSVIAVAANKSERAPSWVISLTPRSQSFLQDESSVLPAAYDTAAPISASSKVPAVHSHAVETIVQSNGTGFSTSCTGLRDSLTGVVYVTGLYEEGLLACKP